MSKLSVIVITFNEEKNIDRCIRSVKKVADELIVVDSLSTDRTKEICQAHNVIFIEHPFAGYIEQKTFALSKVSHDYVLNLDADEALSDELSDAIIKEKNKDFAVDGYTMNRLNYYSGKWIRHGTYYPDRKLRLFNKKKGKYGGYNPHDKVILGKNTSVRHLQGNLLHYTYQSFEKHMEKTKQFSTIAAEALYEKGESSSWFKLWMSPAWSFLHSYIFKLGFLDGGRGFVIAWLSAKQSFLKYNKLIRLYREAEK